jgi:hypothetical protein
MVTRGKATAGRVALAMEGAATIEIKITIPQHQVKPALKRLDLKVDPDAKRYIYFFDTPALDLMHAGVIIRARRVVGDTHDSTVKFRPVVPEQVKAKWTRYNDFKIEADASEKGLVKSASFSMPVDKGLIKRVAAGKGALEKLFTPQQQAFLKEMTGHEIDFSTIAVLGPITAHRWRVNSPACPWPITVELWRREDGAQMLEASIKTPAVQAAAAVGGFMAFLAEMGAEQDNEQQTKTRWALEYYAGKLPGAVTAKLEGNGATPAAAKKSATRTMPKVSRSQ